MSKINISKLPSISNNSYYLKCSAPSANGKDMGCSYTVCQHTVITFQAGKLKGFDGCRKAITERKCKAVGMMVEEIKSGVPIYFVDSAEEIRLVEEERASQASSPRGKNRLRRSHLVSPKPNQCRPLSQRLQS
jgi:hypothetical protein